MLVPYRDWTSSNIFSRKDVVEGIELTVFLRL